MSAIETAQVLRSGRFERRVAHDNDIFGGSTRASIRVQMKNHHHMHHVPMCADFFPLLRRAAVGDVVFGDLCDFCNNQHDDIGDADAMNVHACVAQVIAVDHETGAVQLGAVLEPLALVDSLDVDFVHTPGNRTHAEAMQEARKRDAPLAELRTALQFEAINFNFDARTRTAAKPIDLPKLGALFGGTATCAECYAHLTAGVEFALRIEQNAFGSPVVQFAQLVLFGELGAAAVLEATWPLSHEAEFSVPLVESELFAAPLVIPLGLLAVTIRPSVLLQLEATASFSLPLKLTFGARKAIALRTGVQVVAGEPLRRIQSTSDQSSLVASLTGTDLGDIEARASAGIGASIELGVALTLAALALVPTEPLVTVGAFVRPQATLAVERAAAEGAACALPLGYAVTAGVICGVTVSPFELTVGALNYSLTLGGVLPFTTEFAAIPDQAPPGCTKCSGCLGALDQLAGALLKSRGPDLIAPPLPSPPEASPSETFVVSTAPADAVSIGAPLTVKWTRGAAFRLTEIERVTFAVEVRRTGASDSALQAVTVTSEQLDVRVAAADSQLMLAALRPFALGLVAGRSQVRFVVIAANSDALFGRSAWLEVRAPAATAATAAATRVHGAWSTCSVECGSGGVQSRRADCLSGDGARSLPSAQCATGMSPQRACASLLPACAFVRYSVIWPRPETLAQNISDFAQNFDYAVLGIEFNGGEAGRNTTISLCQSGTFDPCTTKRPIGCEPLTSLPVSTSGTTRTLVDLRLGEDSTYTIVPRSFSLLFDNNGGSADQWRLTPPFTVRAPGVRYVVTGEIQSISGPMTLTSLFGLAILTLQDRQYESARVADLGKPQSIGFNMTATFFTLQLRIDYPTNTLAVKLDIVDKRTVKTPGVVVAHCKPMFLTCSICNANDTSCSTTPPEHQWYFDRLPDVCAGRTGDDIWATAPPDQPVLLPDPTGLASSQANNDSMSSMSNGRAEQLMWWSLAVMFALTAATQ